MLQDLRAAIRAIVKDRWLAAAAIVALALGIGVNATVFTLVNAVLIRGLPFPDSGNLYVLGTRRSSPVRRRDISRCPTRNCRTGGRRPPRSSTWRPSRRCPINIADDRGAARAGQRRAGLGRTCSACSASSRCSGATSAGGRTAGAERVVILGNAIWKNRYGADPERPRQGASASTASRRSSSASCRRDQVPDQRRAVDADHPRRRHGETRSSRAYSVAGRVRPGVGRAAGPDRADGIAARLAAAYPDTNKDIGATLQTFNERFNGGEIRTVFLALHGRGRLRAADRLRERRQPAAVARHPPRPREWRCASRSARPAGASSGSCWSRACSSGVVGGVLGLLLAVGGVRLFDAAVADVGKPYWIVFTMDYVVFGFLAAVCVVTGIIFGIAPALADLEDQRQRTAEGRRPRQRRQPPHALADEHDGRRRTRADARPARRRRPDGPQLPAALHR